MEHRSIRVFSARDVLFCTDSFESYNASVGTGFWLDEGIYIKCRGNRANQYGYIGAPIAGRVVDRYGPRMVMVFGLLAIALGCFIIATVNNKILFLIAFGFIAAIGFGLIAVHVVSTAIEQKFSSRQGLAIGISTSGSTGGQFIIVPLIAMLLTITNWRVSFALLGLICLVMILPVLRLLPSQNRILGEPDTQSEQPDSWVSDLIFICKRPAFHVLFWSYVMCGYTTTGIIETHFLPFASYSGFDQVPSAVAFGILSAVNIVGMIIVGWLTDKVNRPLLLCSLYIIRASTGSSCWSIFRWLLFCYLFPISIRMVVFCVYYCDCRRDCSDVIELKDEPQNRWDRSIVIPLKGVNTGYPYGIVPI